MSKLEELRESIDIMTTAIYSDEARALLKKALDQAVEIERGDKVVVDGWKPVTEPLPFGNYLITNNITACYKNGDMSHVWHTDMVHVASEPKYGPFTAFYGEYSSRIWGVSHYIDLSPTTKKGQDDE